MRIVMQTIGDLSCPRVCCDICGKMIEDGRLAMVKWHERIPSALVVCHKGECDQVSWPVTRRWPWQELNTHLVYILRNLKLDLSEESKRADMMSSI